MNNRNSNSPRPRFSGPTNTSKAVSTHGSKAPARSGGFKRPAHRGGGGGGGRFQRKSTLDINKFVRKATVAADEKAPVIKHRFIDFKFTYGLQNNLRKKGFNIPTPVQDQSIPHIMAGKDVVGLANTGTGKTGAFLLPLIEKVFKDTRERVIILAPTRELALQIDREFREFAFGMKIFSTLAVGGMPIYAQINGLAKNPNFVIGTPGRIDDLAKRGKIKFASFNNVVLDEVDHMLDMGFIEPITEILKQLNPNRQSLFFSATMPANIRALIKKFTKDPVTVEIASRDTINTIDQDIVRVVDKSQKFAQLKEILSKPGFDKVLIFCETKRGVDQLLKDLHKEGFKAESIHGNKRQSQRAKALTLFDRSHVNILVATDVAARGLDIKDITHVINYTIPNTHEDYTHRIGRTGRGSKKGQALTFVG